MPPGTDAVREAARDWRRHRRARADLFLITDNLAVLRALVVADLSESQSETLMNLIFQRGIDSTTLTLERLREFVITLSMLRGHRSKTQVTLTDPERGHSLLFRMDSWMIARGPLGA